MAKAYSFTEDEVRAIFHRVFDTNEGKVVLALLEDFVKLHNGELILDMKKMVYMQGRKSVVLKIKEILNSGGQDEQ